ncbi:RNA recognition domain-containing protein [Wuchereria bancrofti]|uniref:RNA recognition domain-containing protein n=2 Tax=Wuchereria bancrofti TaxID=6293 RepID=J9FGC0_WUCBA|nr:RNA recognition domain-containing protein [Wuchereria bancrofti]
MKKENQMNMLEEETNLKDFEREVEEELFEGNAAKKDAISSRFFEIALKKVQQKKWKEVEGLVGKTEEHSLNRLCTAEASEKTKNLQGEASGRYIMKLKEMSAANGILEMVIGSEMEKIKSEKAVQANNEKCVEKGSVAGPSSTTEWENQGQVWSSRKLLDPQSGAFGVLKVKLYTEYSPPLLLLIEHNCTERQKYIELFPATNIPHPIKTVTFRTVSGAPTRLTAAPRPLYSSFAEDEEAAYASGVGGQQYYNDQYEGRQSKYGRDWGEPTRLMLKNVSDCLRNVLRKAKQVKDNWMDASLLPPTPADSAGDISDEPVRKSRRKEYSYALLLAYQGKKYNGMQLCIGLNQCMRPLFYELGVCDVNVQYWQYLVQKDFPTIEGELFKAMAKCGYICENDVFSPVRFAFQRAARTDRSVSAARQMCSMRLAPENHEYFLKTATDKLNAHLPEEIRVLGVRRAIRSFKAHKNCDKRTYSYTLPTYAFARANELTNSGFRMSETSMAELNDLLALYKGTHNFFNYTSGRRVFNSAVNNIIQ